MTTSRFRACLAGVAALLASVLIGPPIPVRAQAGDGRDKLDRTLQHRAEQGAGRSRVIIEFAGGADEGVITRRRGRPGRRLAAHRLQVAHVDDAALVDLASDPRVARVTLDRPVVATLARTGAATGTAVAHRRFGVTGAGVGVAIVDSGVAAWHDDLYLLDGVTRTTNPVVHFEDFTKDPANRSAHELPSDDYGHGTHVAGSIVSSGFDSDGARRGLAPGAHLIALKVLDAEGRGYMSDVIAALDYAVEKRHELNIRVINLSVAAGVFESYWTDPLARAAKRAVDAGIVVVAAAGNLGLNERGMVQYGGITSPGNAPWVLTVGAASHQGTTRRSDDIVADFSSRGPTWIDFGAKPDLVAPGVGIESTVSANSTLARMYPEYLLDGTHDVRYQPYLSLSGTSMAAPLVSATVALMLEMNPALTPNAVKALLQYTAQVHEGESALAQGAGLLNTAGAVRMAHFFAHPEEDLTTTADRIEGELVPWSRQILWGNRRVTGGVPLPGMNAWETGVAWGAPRLRGSEAIVFGARTDDAAMAAAGGRYNIVWATGGRQNIVWATGGRSNIVWATGGRHNIVWATSTEPNVVWEDDCGGDDCRATLWGAQRHDGTLWGTAAAGDPIVWPTGGRFNIVWATGGRFNIVWATGGRSNIVWATGGRYNIVWATGGRQNIVWATGGTPQVVWAFD